MYLQCNSVNIHIWEWQRLAAQHIMKRAAGGVLQLHGGRGEGKNPSFRLGTGSVAGAIFSDIL